MSFARGLLIVVYCSLSDHVIFMPVRLLPTAPQSAWEIKSIKRFLELFFCQALCNFTSQKNKQTINLLQFKVPVCNKESSEEIPKQRKNTCSIELIIGEQVKNH